MNISAPKTRRNVLIAALLVGGCAAGAAFAAPGREGFADIPYADWTDYEPSYRLYPGDEVEGTVPSAPELNKTVVVQPDGRISLALVGPIMVADRTVVETQGALGQAYSRQLLRPEVNVSVRAAPGVIEMAGDSDALRAIVQAGGFRPSADLKHIIILRRGPDGRGMMRTVNLAHGLNGGGVDLVPLRRFDVVFVPRSGVARAGLFVQQYLRDLQPVQVGFSYALGEGAR
jgi:protein involved in polysaccharide export with SLBB domain